MAKHGISRTSYADAVAVVAPAVSHPKRADQRGPFTWGTAFCFLDGVARRVEATDRPKCWLLSLQDTQQFWS